MKDITVENDCAAHNGIMYNATCWPLANLTDLPNDVQDMAAAAGYNATGQSEVMVGEARSAADEYFQ